MTETEELAALRAENERLTRLNEDKFRTIQAYCKAADEDKATNAALRARLAAADGLAEAIDLLYDDKANPQDTLMLIDAALAAYRATATAARADGKESEK